MTSPLVPYFDKLDQTPVVQLVLPPCELRQSITSCLILTLWPHGMKTWCHPQNRKYLMYRSAVRGGPDKQTDSQRYSLETLGLGLEAAEGQEKYSLSWSWRNSLDIFKTLINNNTCLIISYICKCKTLIFTWILLWFQWLTVKLIPACNVYSSLEHFIVLMSAKPSQLK